MITNKSKGFTIIELLVVIAIIAVLAAIVFANVFSAIAKGKNAAIKANLSTLGVNSAVFYDTYNTYVGFAAAGCVVTGSDPTFVAPRDAIVAAGGTIQCPASTASSFCARSTLNGGGDYCVDSTGFKGAPTASTNCATGGTSYVCQ